MLNPELEKLIAKARPIMDIQKRISIEKRIVRRFVDEAWSLGYMLSTSNGPCGSPDEAIESIMACDEARVTITKVAGLTARPIGRVLFVFGNDGFDCIADHSTGEELTSLLKGADEIAEQIESEELTSLLKGADEIAEQIESEESR